MHRQDNERSRWSLPPPFAWDWLSHSAAALFIKSCWHSMGKNTNYFYCSLTSNSCTTSKTDFRTQPRQKEQFSIFLLYKNVLCAIYQLQAGQRYPDLWQILARLPSLNSIMCSFPLFGAQTSISKSNSL